MELWKQILLMLNNQEYSPKGSSKICIKHFKSSYILYNFGKVSLSSYANPTLFYNSPINSNEVIDYLISQNAKDPLALQITENPKKSLKRKADHDLPTASSNEALVKITRITTNSPKKKSNIDENSSKDKQFSNSGDVFKNMEKLTDWTLTEMKDAFNILKSTLDQRTKQIQALLRKNNRLESLLARFCVDDLNKKDQESEICKICLKKFPRETKPFYLNVQITDKWLPTFLNKFKSCSGDILLTKVDKILTPVCDNCLQHVLANYTAVFSGEKEPLKNPILNVDIKEHLMEKIIPEEVVNNITENTTGKVIILKKISRSKIPNILRQTTRKKLAVTPNTNPSNVNIIRTTLKNASKPKWIDLNKRKEADEVSEETPILEPKSTEEVVSVIICEYCGESFTDKKIHLQHQSTHWADMKFVCNKCNTCFLTDADLKLHTVIHCNS